MADDKQSQGRQRFASKSTLPIASVITDPDVFNECKDLLREAADLTTRKAADESRLNEIKETLSGYSQAYELRGMRHGLAGFEYRGWTTRRTLSKEKLVENGVDPETIAASYSESDEFLDTRIVVFDGV